MPSQKDPLHQPFKIGNHLVSGVWQYYMPPELIDMKFPKEERANCGACPKAKYEGYRADYKCCTYHPRVSNFSLGLAATNAPAQRIIKELNVKGWLVPEGMLSSPILWYDYLADLKEDQFGVSKKVLCPFLQTSTGLCQIYAYRNGVCSTFFCMHDQGERGEKFWENLQVLAIQNEMAIGQWCMYELGFDLEKYFRDLNSFAEKVTEFSDEKTRGWRDTYREILWQNWYGKEMEFLQACGDLVSKHRDKLQMVGNVTDILEANEFDKAQAVAVPKNIGYKIGKDEFGPGETMSPNELFTRLKKIEKKLWSIPDYPMVLSESFVIHKNPLDTKESQDHKAFAFQVGLKKKKNSPTSAPLKWRLYVHESEANLLKSFSQPKLFSASLASRYHERQQGDPEAFVSRWVGLKVLIRAHHNLK